MSKETAYLQHCKIKNLKITESFGKLEITFTSKAIPAAVEKIIKIKNSGKTIKLIMHADLINSKEDRVKLKDDKERKKD